MMGQLPPGNSHDCCTVHSSAKCELRLAPLAGVLLAALLACSCTAFLPSAGPYRSNIKQEAPQPPTAAFQVVEVDDAVTRRLLALKQERLFSEALGNTSNSERVVGPGDVLEVWIWEASPALLFSETSPAGLPAGASSMQAGSNLVLGSSASHAAVLPEQAVDDDGRIYVPFAGYVAASGKTLESIAADIAHRLAGKANQPEVLLRFAHGSYSTVTVVGDVTNSIRAPLTPGSDRVLDALAAASGLRTTVPVSKAVIQVTRGERVYSEPLESIIRDPRDNVPLHPGDVVTALFQPYTYTVLGASGKPNDEISFEAKGISLAQALGRVGGLDTLRSDVKGVFLFRFESRGALESVHEPAVTTPDGRLAVVYRLDLSDPRSFFLMQSFPINDKDVLYVSDAPSVGLQKFLNILVQATFPISAVKQAGY